MLFMLLNNSLKQEDIVLQYGFTKVEILSKATASRVGWYKITLPSEIRIYHR